MAAFLSSQSESELIAPPSTLCIIRRLFERAARATQKVFSRAFSALPPSLALSMARRHRLVLTLPLSLSFGRFINRRKRVAWHLERGTAARRRRRTGRRTADRTNVLVLVLAWIAVDGGGRTGGRAGAGVYKEQSPASWRQDAIRLCHVNNEGV